MAMFQIPIDSTEASFKIRTDLEDTTFVLELKWNVRLEKWHISILDADENPILMGVPLNINFDVLGRFRIPELPQGILILYDGREKNLEAGRDDLGSNAFLVYRESSDV